MSSQPWGDKRWSSETKRRRLAQARAVMDQIDEKYKTKEEEQYLDPDKGFAELRDPTAPRPIADDKDAIKSFKGDFAFLGAGREMSSRRAIMFRARRARRRRARRFQSRILP